MLHPHFLRGRLGVVGRFLLTYIALNAALRLGLLFFNGDLGFLAPTRLLPIFGIGLLFDLAAAAWWLFPFLMLVAIWPARAHRSFLWVAGSLLLIVSATLAFVSASEFFFWNEFASRFNFIAVDYLLFTREVVGNIRESYDLRPAFAGIALATLALFAAHWRPLRAAARAEPLSRRWRGGIAVMAFVLPPMSFELVEPRYKEFTDEAQAVQLAGNGHYEFWSAFRNNEIDYPAFYLSRPLEQAYKVLRAEYERVGPTNFVPDAAMPIEREIPAHGPEKRLNVVMVTIESLSADYMAAFGNENKLTPNLDRLAQESLFFTQLYATGLRTVRGLEAVTLSFPPTPGNSIVKRPNNGRLFSLGEVFNQRGYESLYLYGGYSYFDNMQDFYSGNGYTVIDRLAIAKENIHHETIWGVSDEDLFSLSLQQIDQRHTAGKPFFAHIMTTSNHRPYTYPEGRIDIPSGSGRRGAVKYTDWAIGEFIRQARTRPWFNDTVFVILADHTSGGRGKSDLEIENFHIPLMIWSPGHIKPERIDTLASQIDVPPTLLALLNVGYRSRFFGHDILRDGPAHQRAFMANYQTVGYLENGILVELRPQQRWRLVDAATGQERAADAAGMRILEEAVSYYQTAAEAYRSGALVVPGKP